MWDIYQYDELSSTQELARQMIESGNGKHGDVYQALHQTAGRGRFGTRTWLDSPGENLLISVILTHLSPHIASRIQFLCGISVVRAIRILLDVHETEPNHVRLKWTNDILIGKHKIGGVLCDALWSSHELRGIVAGIGINVNQMFFEGTLRTPATSLRLETNIFYPLEEVRTVLLQQLEYALSTYLTHDALMQDVRDELAWMKTLSRFDAIASDGSAESSLHYVGISDEGSLWAVNEQGDIRTFQNATLLLH